VRTCSASPILRRNWWPILLSYLKKYADTSGDTWTWKTDSPIGGKLSPNALRSFQRAAEIREAFFTYGREPSVDFLITPRGIHESLEQAQLTVGRMIILGNREGGFPNTVSWPRDGGIATVSLMPQPPNQPLGGLFGQASQPQTPPAEREKLTLTKDNSYWALFQLLDTGNANLTHRGNSTTATFTVRGRWARFEITPKSRVSPIRLPAVGQFECPTAL
jgi:type VI secretion system protein ImpL